MGGETESVGGLYFGCRGFGRGRFPGLSFAVVGVDPSCPSLTYIGLGFELKRKLVMLMPVS